uniref:Uncharacterized protein n=1 Tax=Arundo donax TaxID=35708 RepID=A0A0A9B7X6_ARUDO
MTNDSAPQINDCRYLCHTCKVQDH